MPGTTPRACRWSFPREADPLYGDGGNVRYWAGYLGSSREV